MRQEQALIERGRASVQADIDALTGRADFAEAKANRIAEEQARDRETRAHVRSVAMNEHLPPSVRGAAVDWLVNT